MTITIVIIIYIILGLPIGTLIVFQNDKRLFKQLKNESDDCYNRGYNNGETVNKIFWYYVIWPFPATIKLWFTFWKYSYLTFQKTIQGVIDLWNLIFWYFKNRFLKDLYEILKDKK